MEGDNEAAQLREVVLQQPCVSGEYVVRWRLKPAIGVVLQLVLWFVSELYTYCFSLVLCGVWLYSIFVAEDLCTGFDLPKVLSMKFRWGIPRDPQKKKTY